MNTRGFSAVSREGVDYYRAIIKLEDGATLTGKSHTCRAYAVQDAIKWMNALLGQVQEFHIETVRG